MSNRVYLDKVKITYIKSGISQIGFIIFDDLASIHHLEFNEGVVPDDDLDLLKYAYKVGLQGNSELLELIEFVIENEKGITINNTYYEYDVIKKHVNIEDN